MPRKRRIVEVNVLHGDPIGGTGRICIHLFVQDDRGPFVEPHALHPVFENGVQVKQQCTAKPTRGRLACDPKRVATSTTRGGVTVVTPRTDDWRAVTCPKCKVSKDYVKMMSRNESTTATTTDKEFDEATKRHDGTVDFAESHPRSKLR